MDTQPRFQLDYFLAGDNLQNLFPRNKSSGSFFHPTPFLCRLTNILETHYTEEAFNVSQLCQLLCLCPMQVHRKIKRHTGLTPGKYLLAFRLVKAIFLLHNTDLAISDIAWQTGFGSLHTFTRAFSREFGNPPRQVRLKLERKVTNW